MSAKFLLYRDTIATLDDTGEWHCDRPRILRILQSMIERHPSQRYLPDPYEKLREGVIKEFGGKLLELTFPPPIRHQPSPDGTPPIH